MKKLFFLNENTLRILGISVFFLIAFLAIPVLGRSKVSAAAAYIYGTVYDSRNANPVAGATVTLRTIGPFAPGWCGYSIQNGTFTATTDAAGNYSFGRSDFSDGVCCNSGTTLEATAFWYSSGIRNISGQFGNGVATRFDLTIIFPSVTNTLNVNSTGTGLVAIGGSYPGSTNYTVTRANVDINGTLTAPLSTVDWASRTWDFTGWTGCDGVSGIFNVNCSIAVTGGGTRTVTANYTLRSPTTNTLSVNSSPPTGMFITSASGSNSGVTNYTKTSSSTISDTLTAPASSGSYTFSFWSGCTSWSGTSCNVSVSGGGSQTVTANYSAPLGTNTLNVNSSPVAGIAISGAYPGTTNYSQTSSSPLNGTLFAPVSSGSYNFTSWSGCTSWSGTSCNVSVSGGGTQTVMANYTLVGGSIPDLTIRNNSGGTVPPITVGGAAISGNTVTTTVGTAVTFNFRTVNIGTGSAGASCTVVEAFGSTFTPSATSCESPAPAGKQWYYIGGLVVDAYSSATLTTQWNTAGTYSMLFRADAKGNVAESNENNNDVVLTVVVANASLPDLIIAPGSLSTSPGGPYTVGDNLSLRGQISNIGAAPTGTFYYARFCVDNPNCLTTTTGRVGADILEPTLAAGVTTPLITSTTGWLATVGSHTIYMCADVTNLVVESNEANNCASLGPITVNPLLPNLQVSSIVTSPATIAIGTPMNITATVINSGAVDITTQFYNRLIVNPDNCPGGCPDQTIPTLTSSSSTSINWTYTPTVSGNHDFQVCADTSDSPAHNNLITEWNEGYNCMTVTVSVNSALPWLKTTNGNVGSVGNSGVGSIVANWPVDYCPSQPDFCNSRYLIAAANSVSTHSFKSLKGWLLTGYNPGLGKYKDYSKFYTDFSENACSRSGNNLPEVKGRFVFAGSVNWNGGFDSTPCSAFSSNPFDGAIVFIGGNLRIRGDLILTRPTVFIVQGRVVIESGVRRVNGMFVVNGNFDDGGGANRLTINGSVAAALKGTGNMKFGRDLGIGNNTNPAEVINFKPEYLYLLANYIGVTSQSYRELNP